METSKRIELLMTACKTALKDDRVGVMMQRVLAAADSGNIDTAIELAKKTLSISPIHLDPMVVMGVLLEEKSQHIGAINYFHQIISQNPNNALVLWYAARDRLCSGRAMEAAALLKAGSDCEPTDSYTVVTLAWLLQMLGNANDAKSLIYSKLLTDSSKFICITLAMLLTADASYLNNLEQHHLDKDILCLNDLSHVARNNQYGERLLNAIVNGSNNNALSHNTAEFKPNCLHLINPALEVYKNRYGQKVVVHYVRKFFKEILGPEIKKVLRGNKTTEQTFSKEHNQLPPDMVIVPSGEYIIGTNLPNTGHPEKKCFVPAFLIDRYPVTNQQWREFQPTHQVPKGYENHPVTNVDFIQATLYARWRGKRLPTEIEWEAAARGREGFRFPWGSNPDPNRANCAEKRPAGVTPVTQYPRGVSPCGALDMLGNVMEWVDDWGVPDNGRLINRVTKGCGFGLRSVDLACWLRNLYPTIAKGTNIGFRCVMDI
jgi:formylglycine-generating enzyme required for sulfatase activity